MIVVVLAAAAAVVVAAALIAISFTIQKFKYVFKTQILFLYICIHIPHVLYIGWHSYVHFIHLYIYNNQRYNVTKIMIFQKQ